MKPLDGLPLFSYPRSPGFHERTTSRDAALAVRSDAATLREKVYAAILAAGYDGLTADEAAKLLNRSVLSVRPRVTELSKEARPRIVRTDKRRANDSGLSARVWRAA